MSILTAERLVKLAYKYPNLHNTWFIIASAALSVVNHPEEISKVFHFALRQQLLEAPTSSANVLSDKTLIQLAQDSINSSEKYKDFTAVGVKLPDILIPYSLYDKLPLAFKYTKTEDIFAAQTVIAKKFREVLLKGVALAGLPKSINALTILKNVTPTNLKPDTKPVRTPIVFPGHVKSSNIVQEDVAGTRFEEADPGKFANDTIDGPISEESINTKEVVHDLVRGSNFWNAVYTNKINVRIKKQMAAAYPDLWHFAYHHCYGPLLSFTDILSARETSFTIVSSLIPQDVNPQLKGHLRGALNGGATKEELDDLRNLVIDICDWSGNVSWAQGKESIAKL